MALLHAYEIASPEGSDAGLRMIEEDDIDSGEEKELDEEEEEMDEDEEEEESE